MVVTRVDGELHEQVSYSTDGPRTRGRPQETAAFRRERRQDVVTAAARRQGAQTILPR